MDEIKKKKLEILRGLAGKADSTMTVSKDESYFNKLRSLKDSRKDSILQNQEEELLNKKEEPTPEGLEDISEEEEREAERLYKKERYKQGLLTK